jgi:hypothetical protein
MEPGVLRVFFITEVFANVDVYAAKDVAENS